MNDRDLTTLLRMAVEAEALEHARPAEVSVRPAARRWLLPGFVAAAATLLITATVWLAMPAPKAKDGGPIVGILKPAPANLTIGADSSVVLAVFQADDGNCRCVVRRDIQPIDAGSSKPDRLISAALAEMCMGDAEKVLVIGLTGPLSDLPRTHEAAQAIVRCMPDSGDDHTIRDTLAARCVPSSVYVTASTVALAPR